MEGFLLIVQHGSLICQFVFIGLSCYFPFLLCSISRLILWEGDPCFWGLFIVFSCELIVLFSYDIKSGQIPPRFTRVLARVLCALPGGWKGIFGFFFSPLELLKTAAPTPPTLFVWLVLDDFVHLPFVREVPCNLPPSLFGFCGFLIFFVAFSPFLELVASCFGED